MINNIIKKHKLFLRSLFWGVLAGVLSQGFNFVANILIARVLGSSSLGELTLYMSTNTGLQAFGVIGLNISATILVVKYIQEKEKIGKIIPIIYGMICCVCIFIAIIGLLLHYLLPNGFQVWETNSEVVLGCAIIWFFTSTIDQVQFAILIGFQAFKDVAKISLLKGVISLLIIYMLVLKFGVAGGVLGYAISFVFSVVCNNYFIYKNCKLYSIRLNFGFPVSEFKEVLKFTVPIFFAALSVAPAQWLANYTVYNTSGGNIALSVFAIANQWLVLIQFFPLQMSRVVLPMLTLQVGTKGYKDTEKLGLYFCLLIALLIIVVSFIFSGFIIEKLYHFDYSLSIVPFSIMLITGFFSTINLYLGQTVIAEGKLWGRTFADIGIAISLLLTVYIFMRNSIILALPIGYLVSFTVGTLILYGIKYIYKEKSKMVV